METTTLTAKKKNIKTPRCLGSYVFLDKPRPDDNGDLKYSANLLFPKKTSDMREINAAVEAKALEKFGQNAIILIRKGKVLKNPVRDGDEKYLENPLDNKMYKDHWFINAKSKYRVGIVDVNGQPVDPAEVYSGCLFHASLAFYEFEAKGNKGVGAGLQNLMLVHKGPRIDGQKSAEADFKDFTPDTAGLENLDDTGFGGFGGFGGFAGTGADDDVPF